VSRAPESTSTPAATDAAQAADIDGLVVLTGGALGIGTADGVLVGLAGPGGPVSGFSAANGRLVVEGAGPPFVIADITQAGVAMTWQPIELAATEVRLTLSAPALSPGGSLLAFTASEPGTTDAFQVVTLDLANGDRWSQSFDRESNGPPVWIDGTSLLVEVVPIPGGTRFLRLDTASSSVASARFCFMLLAWYWFQASTAFVWARVMPSVRFRSLTPASATNETRVRIGSLPDGEVAGRLARTTGSLVTTLPASDACIVWLLATTRSGTPSPVTSPRRSPHIGLTTASLWLPRVSSMPVNVIWLYCALQPLWLLKATVY
jgi:hypothetical protein